MSNRDGGHYDSAGNYWPPYSEPPLWRRILSSAVAWALLIVLVAGILGGAYWINSHSTAGPFDDGGCDRSGPFSSRC